MSSYRLTASSLSVAILLVATPASAADTTSAERCRQDLEYLPSFLLENDTGAADNQRQKGEPAIRKAFERAQQDASRVASDDACLAVLSTYLAAWRTGHLAVSPAPQPETAQEGDKSADAPASDVPKAEIKWLSAKTVLFTLPTFHPSQEPIIRGLVDTNRKKLDHTPFWIIDVRNNDGGSDSSYMPLLDAIVVNARFQVGAEFLATPANIESTLRVCELYAPGDPSCPRALAPVAEAMRLAKPGSYVRPADAGESISRIEPDRVHAIKPQRVAVLIDRPCGSSCEEFLLAARQSWNVKLVGRRTFGSLDYSNVLPHPLPSCKRLVWYATSRSLRLPHLPVDAAGIPPDIFLPPPTTDADRAKEIQTVRAMLE
jgi:hypothetical protein